MTEEKVKNRGWVKNVAIIFLAVMLVLTFFSNSIMNRSLPEVAAQYAQSGSITTQIRGSGTIEAAEVYEVKAEDTRRIKSVRVRPGQTVAPGDVLFVLADGASGELEAAKAELADLQYNYQVQLANGSGTGSEELARAREKLADAIAERDALKITSEQIAAYKKALDDAQAALDAGVPEAVSREQVEAAATAMNTASAALETLTAQYGKADEALAAIAQQKMAQAVSVAELEAWKALMAKSYGATVPDGALEGLTLADIPADVNDTSIQYKDSDTVTVNYIDYKKADMALAYTRLSKAQATYDAAEEAYNTAEAKYAAATGGLTAAVTKAQTAYDAALAQKDSYDAAKDNVLACQSNVEQMISSQTLEGLDNQRLSQQIAAKQKEIADMTSGAGGEVICEVDGVVSELNVTSGNTTDPSTPMCTIVIPDRGFTVSISVTKEQAKKVSLGDSADVSTGWWGGADLKAQLVKVTTDPANPNSNKLLVFEVTGDGVEAGSNVTVTVGQRSQYYDVIVPNSAVRTDSNGSFVLVVISKSSPLGNRYVATRVDVEVIAKDDKLSAVSGGVTAWDYVITTANRPIENGMLVRMAEG